jgi:hypothetical protein
MMLFKSSIRVAFRVSRGVGLCAFACPHSPMPLLTHARIHFLKGHIPTNRVYHYTLACW